MARGEVLAHDVMPVVEAVLTDAIDAHAASRVHEMKTRYASFFTAHDS